MDDRGDGWGVLSLHGGVPVVPQTAPAEQAARALQRASRESRAQLHKAAQEFEAFFIAYLMKVMRESIPTGLIENKAGEQFYAFYDQEVGRAAAQAGGLGLAELLEQQLTQTDEGSPKGSKASDR